MNLEWTKEAIVYKTQNGKRMDRMVNQSFKGTRQSCFILDTNDCLVPLRTLMLLVIYGECVLNERSNSFIIDNGTMLHS